MYDTVENRNFSACAFPLPIDGGHNALCLSSAIALDSLEDQDGATSSWVHFAPFGVWKGHEKGTLTFDKEAFQSIIDNFEAVENDIQVDYDHNSINKQLNGPKPAAGWIKALEVRGTGKNKSDGLWGLVEWTKRAATFIRNKEYKYTSPVIDPKATDRKTKKNIGIELFNAALTNDPFLDGQVPLALERLPLQMDIKITDKDKKPEQAVAADQQSADQNAAMQDGGMGGSVVDKIAESLGMEPAAVEAVMLDKMDEITAIIASASEGEGTPADEATASTQPTAQAAASRTANIKDQQYAAMSKRLADLEKERDNEKRKAIEKHVDEKIEGGFILDNLRDDAIEEYLANYDRAERLFANQVVPLGRNQAKENKGSTQATVKLSDVEENSVRGLVACGYKRETAINKIVAQRKVN